MPLQFSNRQPRPPISAGTLMRLGSLAAGLVLVVLLMQSIRSPQSIARLDKLFGSQNQTSATSEEASTAKRELSAKVNQDLLSSLDDNKPFRRGEAEAWYHLLAVARDTPDDEFRQASLGPISYAQLMAQPGHYRGRVVSVSGLAHRVHVIDQGDQAHEIPQVYEVVVQPGAEGNRSILFHCLDLPSGFEELTSPRPIRFDGLFLKNRVYGHAMGLDKAPVIVGQSFEPLDVLPSGKRPIKGPSTPWLVGVAVVSALIAGLILRHALVAPRKINYPAITDDPDSIAAALSALERDADDDPQESETTE